MLLSECEDKQFHIVRKLDGNIDCGEFRVFYVSGIAGADWLENKKVSFFVRRSAMLNSLRNDGKLSGSNLDEPIAQLNSQPP